MVGAPRLKFTVPFPPVARGCLHPLIPIAKETRIMTVLQADTMDLGNDYPMTGFVEISGSA